MSLSRKPVFYLMPCAKKSMTLLYDMIVVHSSSKIATSKLFIHRTDLLLTKFTHIIESLKPDALHDLNDYDQLLSTMIELHETNAKKQAVLFQDAFRLLAKIIQHERLHVVKYCCNTLTLLFIFICT